VSQCDLLFYNRKLKRLVVVELKHGSFKPEYKGYGKPDVMKRAA
jgi:predicted nuclease of restriction endonuclease-like (RecB) superfamily